MNKLLHIHGGNAENKEKHCKKIKITHNPPLTWR
jgi:hypothetical protein